MFDDDELFAWCKSNANEATEVCPDDLLRDWASDYAREVSDFGSYDHVTNPVHRGVLGGSKVLGFVICAADEDSARRIAATEPGDEESEAWLDSTTSSCIEWDPASTRLSLCEITDEIQTFSLRRQLATEALEAGNRKTVRRRLSIWQRLFSRVGYDFVEPDEDVAVAIELTVATDWSDAEHVRDGIIEEFLDCFNPEL